MRQLEIRQHIAGQPMNCRKGKGDAVMTKRKGSQKFLLVATLLSIGLGLTSSPWTALAGEKDEIQAPRGQDVQAPRGQDVQAPRGQDVQAPRGRTGSSIDAP